MFIPPVARSPYSGGSAPWRLVAARDAQLTERDAQLAERDAQLAALRARLGESEVEAARLERLLYEPQERRVRIDDCLQYVALRR